MNIVDLAMEYAVPLFGVGERWLREELQAHHVNVRITDACLRELVLDADAAARTALVADANSNRYDISARHEPTGTYASRLRRELAGRARFLQAWTGSDQTLDVNDIGLRNLTGIARKYALPRAWHLTEPAARQSVRATPTYLNWSTAA